MNIIAHSKGGLDCHYAMSEFGLWPYVASLTTANTPHRGCLFADRLLYATPEKSKLKVADAYNVTLRAMGDETPDFLAAVEGSHGGGLPSVQCGADLFGGGSMPKAWARCELSTEGAVSAESVLSLCQKI